MVLLTAFQLVPLPESIVRVLSPTTVEWHRALTPEFAELLPGESALPARGSWLPITVAPAATENLLVRKAMDRFAGNVSQAARALGLSRSALYRRLEKHGQ